jgi:hypothetical protein
MKLNLKLNQKKVLLTKNKKLTKKYKIYYSLVVANLQIVQ